MDTKEMNKDLRRKLKDLASLDTTVRALADMQEAFKSISKTHTLWLERLGKRIATLEDRLSPQECQSEATSQNMSASNDTNQSDRRDSADQSADLRTRIAAVVHQYSVLIPTAELVADAVIRDLGLEVTVTSESNDGRFRSYAIEGYWEERGNGD